MQAETDTSAEAVGRLAVAADEVWADLLQQMGRASLEGHAVGQMLAAHQREKIEAVGRTLRALLSERDAATARAEAAEREASDARMEMNRIFNRSRDRKNELVKERDAATAERDRMRAALTFYADTSKYPAPLTGGMGALWADCGAIARAALAGAAKEAGE